MLDATEDRREQVLGRDAVLKVAGELVACGPRDVKLVISDAHAELRQAIPEGLIGASWLRCRVHFLRNVLARVPKTAQTTGAATAGTIFEQPDRKAAQMQLKQVCAALQAWFPKAEDLLSEAENDVLTFYNNFPEAHHRQLSSTNPLEPAEQKTEAPQCGGGHVPQPAGGHPLARCAAGGIER